MKLLRNPYLQEVLNKDLQSEFESFRNQVIRNHVQSELQDRIRDHDAFAPSLVWIVVLLLIGIFAGSFLNRDSILIAFVVMTMIPVSFGAILFGLIGFTIGLILLLFGISGYFLLARYLPLESGIITILVGSSIGAFYSCLVALLSDQWVRYPRMKVQEKELLQEIEKEYQDYQMRPSECLEFLESKVAHYIENTRFELNNKLKESRKVEEQASRVIQELGNSLTAGAMRSRQASNKAVQEARHFQNESESLMKFLKDYQQRLNSMIFRLRTIMKEEQKAAQKKRDHRLNQQHAQKLLSQSEEIYGSWKEGKEDLKGELYDLVEEFQLMMVSTNQKLEESSQDQQV